MGMLLASLVAILSMSIADMDELPMGGERIVYEVDFPRMRRRDTFVLLSGDGSVRGESEPGETSWQGLYIPGEVLTVHLRRGGALRRCVHRMDGVPAEDSWGYQRKIIGAPLDLSCQ